jgi:hypothetical protein
MMSPFVDEFSKQRFHSVLIKSQIGERCDDAPDGKGIFRERVKR